MNFTRAIYFTGIEASSSVFSQQMSVSHASIEGYIHNEQERIRSAVDNIVKQLDQLTEGGMVFVFVGSNHAHRLAANLLLQYHTHKDKFEFLRIHLDVHACKLSSRFVAEAAQLVDAQAESLDFSDPSEIKDIYRTLPCPFIHANDSGVSPCYPELESLVNAFIQNFSQKPSAATTSQSFFSPSPAPHLRLISEIKAYLTKHLIKIDPKFMKALESEKNYSFALRCACCYGDGNLVKLLVKYSTVLPIDFNQTSTNGKTALAWFEASKASTDVKKEISALLEEKMGLNSEMLRSVPQGAARE